MGVKVNRDLDVFLELLYKRSGVIGQQEVSHILYAYGVCTHLLKLLSQLDEVLLVVNRAGGVADCSLADSAVLLGCGDGSLKVAGIVQRVKDSYNVYTVFDGFLDESVDNIIRIVLIS